ncbi:hypothetical protein CCP2SC5_730011 [Azospirillaceae bacterium]
MEIEKYFRRSSKTTIDLGGLPFLAHMIGSAVSGPVEFLFRAVEGHMLKVQLFIIEVS